MILQKFSDAESSIYLQNMINDTNTNLEGLISTSTSPNRANYRQIKKGGNIALAYFHDVKLNAIRRFIAHSSFNDKQYFHLIQNIHGPTYTACFRPSLVNRTNQFQTSIYNSRCDQLSTAWQRWDDSESKILEEIYHANTSYTVQNNEIFLWTKLYPCPSCRCVIENFEKALGYTVKVYYNNRDLNNPCDKGDGCSV
ncbi:deaminase domain-containing protein [Paenibacillus sp. FSL H7-0756]|uniref:deaminase domain-containing protein n=1 Tax=Paenibacillus sp. FSL H7-0756 TaxID=2954738 RepID=UPI0030F8DD38